MSILCEFSSVAPPPPPPPSGLQVHVHKAVSSGVVSYIVYVNITTGEAGMLGVGVCMCVCICVCACVCMCVSLTVYTCIDNL